MNRGRDDGRGSPSDREAQRQQRLLQALFDAPSAPSALQGLLRDDAARTTRAVAAYAANAGATAERALAASFPTVQALVGEEAFAALARDYRRREPPRRGDLHWHGEGLPDFVAAHERLAELPYLADVARLDWLVACAEIAPDAAFEPATLSLLAEVEPAALRLVLRPGSALLDSPHPVVAIRAAHADADADAGDDAFARARDALARNLGECAFVWRAGWRGEVAALEPPEAAFTRALLAERTLAEALDAAGAAFAFDAWLARALSSGWLCGARGVPASGEAARRDPAPGGPRP